MAKVFQTDSNEKTSQRLIIAPTDNGWEARKGGRLIAAAQSLRLLKELLWERL
jgi:hypothetical protein